VGTVADRVKETTVTTGTGTYTLDGTVATFQTFVTGIDAIAGTPSPLVWNTVNYLCIQSDANGNNIDVEVGTGTLTDGGTGKDTLSRITIVFSTNGNAAVDWGAGTKTIVCAPQAGDLGGGIESIKYYSATSGSLGTNSVNYAKTITSIDTTRTIVLPLMFVGTHLQDDGSGNSYVHAMEITTATNVQIYLVNETTGIYTVYFAVLQFKAGFLETDVQVGRATLATTASGWETEDITITALTDYTNAFAVMSCAGRLRESAAGDRSRVLYPVLTTATNLQINLASEDGASSWPNVGWQVFEPKSQYIQA